MMKHVILLIALFVPISMIAQSNDSYISIGIGASFPLADFSSDSPFEIESGFTETGIHLNLLQYGQLIKNNVGVHTRIFYNQNSFDLGDLDDFVDLDDWSQLGLVIGPMYTINLEDKVKFDLKPAIGMVATTLPDFGNGSQTSPDLAWSMGVGMRVSLLQNLSVLLDTHYTNVEGTFDNFDYNQQANMFSVNLGLAVEF